MKRFSMRQCGWEVTGWYWIWLKANIRYEIRWQETFAKHCFLTTWETDESYDYDLLFWRVFFTAITFSRCVYKHTLITVKVYNKFYKKKEVNKLEVSNRRLGQPSSALICDIKSICLSSISFEELLQLDWHLNWTARLCQNHNVDLKTLTAAARSKPTAIIYEKNRTEIILIQSRMKQQTNGKQIKRDMANNCDKCNNWGLRFLSEELLYNMITTRQNVHWICNSCKMSRIESQIFVQYCRERAKRALNVY